MFRYSVTVIAMLFASCTPEANGPLSGNAAAKMQAELIAALRADTRVPVLILGRDQFLGTPDAFAQFTQAHTNANRLALREDVTAQLKTLAQSKLSALLTELPAQAQVTRLWIVNGAIAALTKSEAEQLADDPSVKYLFLLSSLPRKQGTGLSAVVTPVRAPFTMEGKRVPWNVERLGAAAVWEQGITGDGIVVGLIDDRVDITHADIAANVWVNDDEIPNNAIDDDKNGYIDDRHGYNFSDGSADVGNPSQPHGTYTAGIAVGTGNSGIATGIAPRARLMPLVGIGFVEVMLALQYALENGADVINMSFSLANQGDLRSAWRMAADHAVAAGLVLVSGAGNFRQTQPTPVQLRIPEDIPSVIAVGGVDEDLLITEFSSTGPVEWGSAPFFGDHQLPNGLIKPDIVAFPGAGFPLLRIGGGYIDPNSSIRGNSFSSPETAGAAALLLSARTQTPAWKIGEILQAGARDLGTAGKDNLYGSGLVNIPASLNLLHMH